MTHVLKGSGGLRVHFLAHGGIISAIEAPDRAGRMANVVLSLPTVADYRAWNRAYYLGALIGRYAGRIAGAHLAIDGQDYPLVANEGANILHGGDGFDARTWAVEQLDDARARLTLTSPDGDQGFPGKLDVAVVYSVMPDNALRIDYEARTDAPTHLNLTSHSYFNLAGADDISAHHLQLFARRRAEIDEAGIPTDSFPAVAGTRFDFRRPRPIGADRFDHSWLIDEPGELALAARLSDPGSGRSLEILTSEPTVHVYTAGHFPIDGPLRAGAGIALEAQHLPDIPHRPDLPSTLLRPGHVFRSTTIYRFGTDG
jgi:aldose 1-epimerase